MDADWAIPGRLSVQNLSTNLLNRAGEYALALLRRLCSLLKRALSALSQKVS